MEGIFGKKVEQALAKQNRGNREVNGEQFTRKYGKVIKGI